MVSLLLSIFNLENVNDISTDLINRFISDINTLRTALRSALDTLSNVNFTKANFVEKAALGSSKFPGSSSGQQRKIAEEKISTDHIKISNHGLDYTAILSKNAKLWQYHEISRIQNIDDGVNIRQ